MTTPTITYHEFSVERDVLRNPQGSTSTERTRRALILILLTLVLPGAAQITAGSRALGRFALAVTLGCWSILLLTVIMLFTMRGALLTALTQQFVMWAGSVILVALAIGWLILWLDTARLVKFGPLAPGARAIAAVVLVALMTVTSGGLAYGAHVVHESRQALAGIFEGGESIPVEDGRFNFLLMGADSGEGRTGLRPDSIHVISVDASTAETVIFSIPRNFQNAQFREGSPMAEVYPEGYNCGNECIINFLYTEVHNSYTDLYPDATDPGAAAMMDAVSGTLDLQVHGYVMVDMGGFSELIDAMGGVTVESGGYVPYRGRHPDTNQWGDQWFEPGTLDLDGDEALAYARSRDFASDYNRIQRQQCIQQAMISQFSPQTLLTRFAEVMEAGENLVETNLAQSQLGRLLDLAARAGQSNQERLTIGPPDFTRDDGLFTTYPDFDEIHARVEEMLNPAPEPEETQQAESEEDTGTEDQQEDDTSDDAGEPAEPDHSDEAIAEDEPEVEETPPPTQPDGSELTADYLSEAQARGELGILEQAASTNYQCDPAQ